MALTDVIGQERAVEFLLRSVERGRVSHAYLFYGPPGTGKSLAALNFAKALNCQSPGPDACDQCANCRRIEAGNHPGVQKITPSGAHIKLAQVRELRRQAGFQQWPDGYQVYIIEEAEKLTPEATNALLKTLEEPPPGVVFLLLTAAPWGILPTVLSRCQLVPFQNLSPESLERVLRERFHVEPGRARSLASVAGGQLKRALELDASPEFLQLRTTVESFLEKAMAGETLPLLEKAGDLEKQGAEEFLELLSSYYRDLLVWRLTGEKSLLEQVDRVEFLGKMAERRPPALLAEDVSRIEKTLLYLKRNANRRLALEVLFLGLRNR